MLRLDLYCMVREQLDSELQQCKCLAMGIQGREGPYDTIMVIIKILIVLMHHD